MNEPLWQPSSENILTANITHFAEAMATQYGLPIDDPVADGQ